MLLHPAAIQTHALMCVTVFLLAGWALLLYLIFQNRTLKGLDESEDTTA